MSRKNTRDKSRNTNFPHMETAAHHNSSRPGIGAAARHSRVAFTGQGGGANRGDVVRFGRGAGAKRSDAARTGRGAGLMRGDATMHGAAVRKIRDAGRDRAVESTKETTWIVEQEAELLPFLLERIKHKSRNNIKSILARGQVSVGGMKTTRHNHPLNPGDRVTVSWERVVQDEPLPGVTIVYEDEDLIVIDKQAGLLSIASEKEQEETAYRYLMEYVRRKDPASRIFIVHRLDRDTSGLMLFAKSEEIQQLLQEAWKEAVPERKYYALVEGEVRKDKDTIRTWLKETKTLHMYSSPVPNGGQEAITHYKVLQRSKAYSLLEVWLETGRKNQIRVHMEAIGHSVIGDKKYGAKSDPIGRLGLHAGTIAFYHPTTGELMHFESKIPGRFLSVFKQ